MFSTFAYKIISWTTISCAKLCLSMATHCVKNWGERVVIVLKTPKQSFQSLFQDVFSAASKWTIESCIDKIKCVAFVVFLNLSWILDSDLCPRLPGRLVILWSSRAMSLFLSGHAKDAISIGQKVFAFRAVAKDYECAVDSFKRESDRVHDVVGSLKETREGYQAVAVRLDEIEEGAGESVARAEHVATNLGTMIAEMDSDLLRIAAAHAEEERLNEKTSAIIVEYKAAAKRQEKAFATMKLALSLALASPTAKPIVLNGRSIEISRILGAAQIAERFLEKA